MRFTVIAIPLNRPEVTHFLLRRAPEPNGAPISCVGQRPTAQAERVWVDRLAAAASPGVDDLLAIDDPHTHLVQTWTDRLVPAEFLRDPGFLTRNMGGWTPIYFGVVEVTGTHDHMWQEDPLLRRARLLADYGPRIRALGADPGQVADRLQREVGQGVDGIVRALAAIQDLRLAHGLWPTAGRRAQIAYIGELYEQIASGSHFASPTRLPIPRLLLLDELLGQMVALELARRRALTDGKAHEADAIAGAQQAWADETGLDLILKGEYIVGRHRRSTVLLAPELDVVVKQPAPEPLHEIALGAEEFEGEPENWPYLTGEGALVTPRGRIRLTLEEGLIPALNKIFHHEVAFSTLLGFGLEPFVRGKTVQEAVLDDPSRLTPELYEEIVLHQQVCEALGVENGDWHSANFILRAEDGTLVHIDWGAARPLRSEENTEDGRQARLNQVQNIAYSFHDDSLADRTLQLHRDLIADPERLATLRRRAQAKIGEAGARLPAAE